MKILQINKGSLWKCIVVITCFLISIDIPALGQAVTVIRGPYLQNGTSSSIIIRWRTDVASDSRVYYGTDLANLVDYVDDATSTTEHQINITGLSAYTKYFYSAGSTSQALSGTDSSHHFITPPVPGTVQPIRVWAIGDHGEGNTNQERVRDGYTNYSNNQHTDVWIWLGDNAYNNGRDDEYQAGTFDKYPEMLKKTIFWPTPGNHDYGSTYPIINLGADPYFNIINVPINGEAGGLASGTESYYSYDYGNVHFVSLNSEDYSIDWFSLSLEHSPAMLTWLENDLAANTNKEWVIAYLHQPAYSEGTHSQESFYELGMEAVRDHILPILENHGVDLVLHGHSHDYERSYLIKGFYGPDSPYISDSIIVNGTSGSLSDGTPYIKYTTGPDANLGTVYAIVGNSSKTGSYSSDGQLDHPLNYTGDYILGSMMIEINGNQLSAYLIDTAAAVFDEFTIIKDPNAAPVANNDVSATSTATSVIIDVQSNDTDSDPLTTTIISGPGNGNAVVLNGDSIQYDPDSGFAGTDTIVYMVCDDGTPPLCDTAEVYITVSSSAITENSAQFVKFKVYPNPFNGKIKIEYYLPNETEIALEVFDMTGKMVYVVFSGYRDKGEYGIILDGDKAGMNKGLYLLKLSSGSKSVYEKIINFE